MSLPPPPEYAGSETADGGPLGPLEDELRAEVARQDAAHGPFALTGRSQVATLRLALACTQDEIDEALAAWRDERRVPGMPHAREELLQVAAVAIRAVRDCWPSDPADPSRPPV